MTLLWRPPVPPANTIRPFVRVPTPPAISIAGAARAPLPVPWRIALVLGLIVANAIAQDQLFKLRAQRWGKLNQPADGKRPGSWADVTAPATEAFQTAGRFVMTYLNRRFVEFTSPSWGWPPPSLETSGPHTITVENVQAYELIPYQKIDQVFYGGLINLPATVVRFKIGGVWGDWSPLNSLGGIGNGNNVTTCKGYIQSLVQSMTHAGAAVAPALQPTARGPGETIGLEGEPAPVRTPTIIPVPLLPPAPAGDPVTQPTPAETPKAPPVWKWWVSTISTVKPQPLPKPAVTPVTPPDAVFPWPGSGPVGGTGQQPRPDLTGIAQEVGKIERKLEIAFSPPKGLGNDFSWEDAWEAFNLLRQLLEASADKGSYSLSSPCLPADQDGSTAKPLTREWDGTWAFEGMIINRLDALAGLIQDSKNLKQPICEGVPAKLEGQDFTLRFVSDEPSPYGTKPLRKRFSYRSTLNIDPESHRQHWENFTWTSGAVIVFSEGLSWGKPRVWAATEEEGKRVLRHAAAIAGVDLDDANHRFVVRTVESLRYGPELLMRPLIAADGRCYLTTRDGPSGPPELV